MTAHYSLILGRRGAHRAPLQEEPTIHSHSLRCRICSISVSPVPGFISSSAYNPSVTPSYVHGPSETPLLGETIGQCLDRTAAKFPDCEALVSCHQGLRYTYRELLREVEAVALGILSLGVQRGDRVGVWSPNCAEWLIAQYALAKAGAIMVNVNPAYRLRELEHALKQSGVSALIAAVGFRSTNYVQMIDELLPRLPALKAVVYLTTDRHGSAMAWADLLTQGAATPVSELRVREASLQFDDPVSIQYTSGTTGT